jgi:DNA-binding transcriptional regulator YhcF (GntR family)
MLIRLNPRSERPIYLQIADSVGSHIDDGSFKTGERLPAARTLGEALGVNMHTVLKAYSELQSRGLVEMRRGRGGVIVSSEADVREAARSLVSSAKRQGLARNDVVGILDEVWS